MVRALEMEGAMKAEPPTSTGSALLTPDLSLSMKEGWAFIWGTKAWAPAREATRTAAVFMVLCEKDDCENVMGGGGEGGEWRSARGCWLGSF